METIDLEPKTEVTYPSLSERIQSTFIDTLFIVILMFAAASVLERYEQAPDWIRIALFFGLWAVYEPLLTSLGGTIGNRIKGISVRRYGAPDQRIHFFQGLLRYTVKMLLGWLSFVTIHTNRNKRAIHDLVAGTVMISTNRSLA